MKTLFIIRLPFFVALLLPALIAAQPKRASAIVTVSTLDSAVNVLSEMGYSIKTKTSSAAYTEPKQKVNLGISFNLFQKDSLIYLRGEFIVVGDRFTIVNRGVKNSPFQDAWREMMAAARKMGKIETFLID